MNRLLKAAIIGVALSLPTATLVLAASAAGATTKSAEQTTTFAVENMTCALCPITVRKAMQNVAGVKAVAVDLDAKTATVTYDPSMAAPKTIGAASMHAGYPAAPAS